ncbi:hypothetical protein SOV_04860 [Sporomusa ovata DSM 2662]|uniref:Putative bacteriophage protein n=1 Tax=Sporomusa ovata TaxID=2378 RepID=A0A0U1KW63_9FIRM|nr:hypothetical protein [Sporomusa ovata]EQB28156.1 hypothetical protein SOV_2c10790 [Sporomusa ovata DSM 2662]CQR71690.1 putative bacteriophage protein [Sporomusa ovata]
MIYRRLDSNGDYVFGSNQQAFISKADAVAQAIYTRLKLLLAEWWEDTQDGLPLFQSILGVRTNRGKQAIDIIIQDRIRGTTDVTGIYNFTSTFDNETRQYSFKCQVDTAYGQVDFGEVTF